MRTNHTIPTLLPQLVVFNPYDSYHVEYMIDLHHKTKLEIAAIVEAYFEGSTYDQIEFHPISLKLITGQLIDGTTGKYKSTKDHVVQLYDLNTNDNNDIDFSVTEQPPVSPSSHYSYYTLALFISIMEYFKAQDPGDRIAGFIEFSWGIRKTFSGRQMITIVFRFKTTAVPEEEHYFDYSSEDPAAFFFNLKLMKHLAMND